MREQSVAVPSGQERSEEGDVRRDEIIREAARLFDERGYNHTSMGHLAEAVGLAKPSLYHYFSGKGEILYCLHQEFISFLVSRHEDRVAAREDPLVQLRAVMRDIFGLMVTHRGHVRVFFEHHRELSPGWRESVVSQRDRYQEMVEESIAEGIRRNELRALDPRLVALGVFGMCNWAYQWFDPEGPLSSSDAADQFFSHIVEGIGKSGRSQDWVSVSSTGQ